MKRKTVDLHIHSGHSSDGTFTVHELFEQALHHQMEAIIIADHDTYEAAGEAFKESEITGIQTIPALELSCVDENRMVHILGYGIETRRRHKLADLTTLIQQSRVEILPQIKKNLEAEGFYVNMEVVNQLAYPHPPVITNFSNAILTDNRNLENPLLLPYRSGGDKADNPYLRFNQDYLAVGSKCYVPEYILDIYTGIRTIREAGGVPVIAHPGEWFIKKDEKKLERMKAMGLQGIEVYTPYHTEEKEQYFQQLAARFDLFQTAGSDYHDEAKKPGHSMGMVKAADMEMFAALKQLIKANREN